MLEGLLRIKEYDEVLAAKTLVRFLTHDQTAKELKRERISRNSLAGTPDIIEGFGFHDILSDEEDDEIELRSVQSDHHVATFITEPKFNRIHVGRQSLDKATTRRRQDQEKKTSYEQGDFITRNIAVMDLFYNFIS